MPRERTTSDDVARSIIDLVGKKGKKTVVRLGQVTGGGSSSGGTTTTGGSTTTGFKNPMRTLGAMIFGGTAGRPASCILGPTTPC